jgi:hypothetical protein
MKTSDLTVPAIAGRAFGEPRRRSMIWTKAVPLVGNAIPRRSTSSLDYT